MTLDPMPSPAPAGPADGGERPSRTGRVVVGVAVIVALLLGIGGVGWAIVASTDTIETARGADRSDTASPTTTATPPDQWDPRLEPLAQFVADTRGRPFDHPVPAEFLDDDAFRERILAAEEDLTPEDRADLDVLNAQLRALGLVGAQVDVFDESQKLVGEGTLAFYDSEEDTITVRGTDIGPAAKVTLVHELTHAWQDQQVDLDRMDDLPDGQQASLRTIAEGDASVVEEAYRAQLSSSEQRQYEDEWSDAIDSAAKGMEGVPDVLQASFTGPYVLGPAFVSILEDQGGNPGIDAALTNPPTGDIEILTPLRWFDGPEPVDVESPALAPGQERLDEAEFGALSLLLTLGQRIDPRVALSATDGWAGDDSLTYRQDGRSCVAVATLAVDDAAADRLESAVRQWAEAGPAASASAERSGRLVTLRSCDVEGQDTPPGTRSSLAVQYAALRLSLFDQVLDQPRVTLPQAACFADNIVQQVTPAEMAAGGSVSQDEGRRRGAAAALACLD